MMDLIRTYLLSITATAIVCSIINRLCGKKGALGASVKLMTGIFLTLTIISPLVGVRLDALPDITSAIQSDACTFQSDGENSAFNAMEEIIIQQTRSYILDKATSLGADITVEVTLSDDCPGVPQRVRLVGKISPYGKTILSETIRKDLGIELEEQIWIVKP